MMMIMIIIAKILPITAPVTAPAIESFELDVVLSFG